MALDTRGSELVQPIAELLSGVKTNSAYISISQPPSHVGHPDEHASVGPFQIWRGSRPTDAMDDHTLPSVHPSL